MPSRPQLEMRIGPPASVTERDAYQRMLARSFALAWESWSPWMDRIGDANLRIVRDGEHVVGGLGMYRMGQFFGGARVGLAGIAGVGVRPESRGRGVARELLTSTLRALRTEGVPMAGLYASTTTLYRRVGFEQAGTQLTFAAPTASLPGGDHQLACVAFDPREHARVHALYEARARAWTGHLDRSPEIWDRITQPYVGEALAYAVGDPIEGYVIFTQHGTPSLQFEIRVRDLVMGTQAAARRLTTLLADLRSLGETVVWTGCASDPLVSLLPEQTARVTRAQRWMLRVVDVDAALTARGYPPVDLALHLRVYDPDLPENEGDRLLTIEKGRGAVTRDGRAEIDLHVRGLAALYSGFATPYALRAAGLVDGSDEALARLAVAFAGPEPWCCDHY